MDSFKAFTRNHMQATIIAFLLIALVSIPITVSADPGDGDDDGEGCWGGGGWNIGSWWFMAAMMVIMGFGALFLFVFVLNYRGDRHTSPPQHQQPPLQGSTPHRSGANPHLILDQRYSSGEISREEYLRMKNDIDH